MPTNADIGANNAIWIGLETTYGTPVDPTAAGVGVWMPILDEALIYQETKYFSPQIRQQAVASSVVPAPYHVEGPVHFEVDVNYLPYLLFASRHTVTRTGASPPYTYTAKPAGVGTAYPGGSGRGLSIYILRNGTGFLYSGCVVTQYSFTLNAGILECTATIIGLAEQDPASNVPTTSWIDAELFGADASSVYVDTAGTAPAFASRSLNFNGFTFDVNHNAVAQNRVNPSRAANYIAYGVTEPLITTELDFLDKTEYTNFKNSTLRSIKLEALRPGGMAATMTSATEAVQIIAYRTAYDTYTVDTRAMGDLVAAAVTMRGLAISGGTPYAIVCKSPLAIT